ncbi:hypothetical protein NDU88_002864 [Pleurodeles waltl]|uniref:Uncharacterized protein n=1 Tax=Pleurodeles waltl TaxID=8319 RepID=A0AAV7MP93_PLEWA|nr:hypothetical protein NDU88_002864 [Pleurodeles waltl]
MAAPWRLEPLAKKKRNTETQSGGGKETGALGWGGPRGVRPVYRRGFSPRCCVPPPPLPPIQPYGEVRAGGSLLSGADRPYELNNKGTWRNGGIASGHRSRPRREQILKEPRQKQKRGLAGSYPIQGCSAQTQQGIGPPTT